MKTDSSIYEKYESEADVIAQAVQTKNVKDVASLANAYGNNIKNLKQIETPQDFVAIHKKQIAIFELTKKILEAVRDFENDPASASAATEVYPQLNGMLENLAQELVTKLEKYQ